MRVCAIRMELAESDFSQLLALSKDSNEPISFSTIKEYLFHVVNALKQIHSRNIAHNDIKLENILIFDKNQAKLADFGYARNQNEKINF